MQIPHREFAEFLTANPPTSSPRIRRLPHHEFPTANSSTYLYRWRISISEFAENPWRMFAQSFVLSANIIHREFGELNSCEFVANIHHVSFKWTVLYLSDTMSNNSIESQSPYSWILTGPCFANKLTVLLWVSRNCLTPSLYWHPVYTKHLYDFIHCGTNVKDVVPTLYKCYTNVLCLLGRKTFSQTLYISPMLVHCWAIIADVGLTLKQRRVGILLE